MALLLTACSSSGTSNQTPADSFELIPLRSLQTTSASGLRGTIDVYNIESSKVTSKDLIFQGGSVFSPNFSLEKGDRYRLIVIFYYDALPIAYLDEYIVLSAEDAQNFTLDGQEVVFDPADSLDVSESLLASINTDVASGLLPDLDADDDGYSNDAERRGGSNAFDSSDVPTGPTFSNVQITYSNDGNDITITATVSDGNLISEVTPTFTTANYLTQGNIVETELSGDELDKERTFTLSFNPQYAPLGELDLSLTATNRLDLSSEEIVTLDIEDNGENVGPVIVFDSLTDGDVVNGDYTIEISAYDRDVVTDVSLTQPSSVANTANSADRFNGVWQTSNFVDGDIEVIAEATDAQGTTSRSKVTVTVQNGSDGAGPSFQLTASSSGTVSETINYNDGEPLYGLVNLTINASDISGVSTLSLVNAQDLGCGPVDYSECPFFNITADSFTVSQSEKTYTFDATLFEDNEQVELKFRATDTKGYVRNRTFVLTIKNSPDINNFTASPDFAQNGEDVEFSWSSDRADSIKIFDTTGEVELCSYAFSEIDAEGIDEPCDVSGLTKSGTYTLVAYYNAETGAANPTFSTSAEVTVQIDADGDGDPEGNDCDDDDKTLSQDTIWYADEDGDGYSSPTNTQTICVQPEGYYLTSQQPATDCDDSNENINPESDWYKDEDSDGYVDTSTTIENTCEQPTLYLLEGTFPASEDCNDTNANINPGAKEKLNGIDDDCDDEIDHLFLGDDANHTITGDESGDAAGKELAHGDLNGDGYEDLIISARHTSYTDTSGTERDDVGTTYVFYGDGDWENDELSMSDADVIFWGEDDSERAHSLGTGDFNDDGCDDLLIGAPYKNSLKGGVYVIWGRGTGCSTTQLEGTFGLRQVWSLSSNPHPDTDYSYGKLGVYIDGDSAGEQFGFNVASGKFNGSDYDDIIVSAPYNNDGSTNERGAVYIFEGTSAAHLGATSELYDATTWVRIYGVSLKDRIGLSIASGEDINDDGNEDILIGSQYIDSYGAVYVVYGGNSNPTNDTIDNVQDYTKISGSSSNGEIGQSVALGKLNSDDYADLIIGCEACNSSSIGSGSAYIVFGLGDGSSFSPLLSGAFSISSDFTWGTDGFRIYGEGNEDSFSDGIVIGDLDGDGSNDIVATAPDHDVLSLSSQGSNYIFLGGFDGSIDGTYASSTSSDVDAIIFGAASSDHLGTIMTIFDSTLFTSSYQQGTDDAGIVYVIPGDEL